MRTTYGQSDNTMQSYETKVPTKHNMISSRIYSQFNFIENNLL